MNFFLCIATGNLRQKQVQPSIPANDFNIGTWESSLQSSNWKEVTKKKKWKYLEDLQKLQ